MSWEEILKASKEDFTYIRNEKAKTFNCIKCNKEKTSKNTVKKHGKEGYYCNGCYGQELAEG